MGNPKTTLAFLWVVAEHEGQWGWYQFERAFPPGWFVDEPSHLTAKTFLDQLKADGLVMTTPDSPRNYSLTEKGRELLQFTVSGLPSD